ncbi:MAG: hypothetical protein KA007_00565 [Candidatus Pacebacteria bacterium]|nr:hypothetical protein [Candidatus Paceibacterota bacterium]
MRKKTRIVKVKDWKIIQEHFYKGELTAEILENAIRHANLLAGLEPLKKT